ncbi:MAG TPA: hypothetical protein PK830_10190 [Candidatus Atribacteria bacterium]|nr:hypothetical protein [Candidatus Atribacteria bacterium]HPT79450.1 hypothetical protein [Candidatus Atribacteria bacterium]
MNKKDIRAQMLAKRNLLTQREIELKSGDILNKFMATERYRTS